MVRTLIAAAALAALPAAAQQPAALVGPGETLLEVQSEGRVRIEPDTATISVGVIATGAQALDATNAASAQMTRIIAVLRDKGVAARDVQTQQVNVSPRFQRDSVNDYEGQARITGYVARNSATVTLRRLAQAPDVVAAAFGAGANSVNGPNFQREDRNAGMAEARRDAIAAARAEADAYAEGFGMRVGRVIRVSERGSNVRSGDAIVVTGSRIAAPAPPPPPPPSVATPFQPGDLLRTTTLWVDFALVLR